MGDRRIAQWERPVDEAWREFRRQLADHLATFDRDELLRLEVQVGPDDDELAGAAPYVQVVGWGGGGHLRAEASSNHYLDERYHLDAAAEQALAGGGWAAPTWAPDEAPDEGSPNWWVDAEVRHADLVAALAVVALRDAFGCPHPAFLVVEGALVLTGSAAGAATEPSAEARAEAGGDEADEPVAQHPRGAEELRELAVAALGRMVAHPVEVDEDGDVPLPVGRSLLYVQPLDDEPTLRLWARLVIEVDDLERAADEVALMNRDLVFGTVVLTESGCIDFHHHLCAMPFAPQQLRLVVARILSDLDRRAGDFVRRVGGHRYLDAPAGDDEPGDDEPGDGSQSDRVPAPDDPRCRGLELDGLDCDPDESDERAMSTELMVLRELLAAGAADPRTVAAVWDGDLEDLALQIDDLRAEPPVRLDVADAIAALRAALVFVAEQRSRVKWSRPQRPPGRRPQSQQTELIPGRELGEATLDLGER